MVIEPKYLDAIRARHTELTEKVSAPNLDAKQRPALQREINQLREIIAQADELEACNATIQDAEGQLRDTSDPEMQELFREEIETLAKQLPFLEKQLSELLVEQDDLDNRSVYLEIRAGTGGQEAALFAGDLLKMYSGYAAQMGWRADFETESATDLGGYREAVLHIQGKNVYGHLKYESGVHRVQRVPSTETQGRVHTSTATVAVLPEAKEVDVQINPADLRIDVYRASGAGGQHVNTTDSAVRITHIPTGVVATCQDERSQHKNKAKAMKMLQSRLLVAQVEKQEAEQRKARKEQVGGATRSEKVRTYNYPQNRITDHRIDLTLKNLDFVMTGNLGEIIDTLRAENLERRRREFLSRF